MLFLYRPSGVSLTGIRYSLLPFLITFIQKVGCALCRPMTSASVGFPLLYFSLSLFRTLKTSDLFRFLLFSGMQPISFFTNQDFAIGSCLL